METSPKIIKNYKRYYESLPDVGIHDKARNKTKHCNNIKNFKYVNNKPNPA